MRVYGGLGIVFRRENEIMADISALMRNNRAILFSFERFILLFC